MIPGKVKYQPLLVFSGFFLLLSALLNFDYPASQIFSWRLLQPSVDVWILLLPLAIAACWGKRLLFWTSLPVYILFLAMRLIRIGDTVVPMYLNRPFNLYIDSSYLFGLYDLLKTSSDQKNVFLISLCTVMVVLSVIILSWYAWQVASRGLLDSRLRILFLIVTCLIFSTAFIKEWYPAKPLAIVRLNLELLATIHQLDQQQDLVTQMEKTARTRGTGPASLKGLEGLEGLKGADVLFFIVESYGHIVFKLPQYRRAMETTMTSFAKILDLHGFTAVSSYIVSPTYGGISRLAHATLEFGLRVENNIEYTALLRSSLSPLASHFRKSGYHTVSVMPGTRFLYPEGSYYDYEQAYYAWHFNYQGPTFGWAPMPDQFVLDWVRRREFVQRKQPLFVRYVMISSHAAFSIQPPFIADWDRIGDGSIYNNSQLVYYPIHWPDLKNAGEAYLRSLDYEFAILGDYFAKYVSADTLIVIMGDHQPNIQLTGAGEPWSVPVHIISRNPCLLEPFRKRGYTPGLVPVQPLPHSGMETFYQDFLDDFR